MEIPYSYSNSLFSNTDYYAAFSNLGTTYNLPVSGDGFSSTDKKQLETALATAQATGDKWWEKALNFALKYGPQVLGVLATTGVIKNKNLNNLVVGDVDADKAADLDSIGQGYAKRNANDNPTQTIKVFGIELTPINLIILVVAIILIYNQFSSPKSKK